MATIFNRCYAFCKNKKIPMFPTEATIEIGKKVNEAWQQKGKGWFNMVDASKNDNGGGFKVIYYPKEFTPEIDAVIRKHYNSKLKVKEALV
jgi:hypothetical protein